MYAYSILSILCCKVHIMSFSLCPKSMHANEKQEFVQILGLGHITRKDGPHNHP